MNLATAESGARAKGKQELIAHLKGEKLYSSQRIRAKCFECMGGYVDGKVDCRIPACPLYPVMPFRGDSDPQSQSLPSEEADEPAGTTNESAEPGEPANPAPDTQ